MVALSRGVLQVARTAHHHSPFPFIALRFVNRDPIAELTILCTGVKQICPIVPLYLRMSAARFRLLAAACDDSALSRSAGWIPRAFMLLGPYAIQEASLRQ